jgi:hypothetical protein
MAKTHLQNLIIATAINLIRAVAWLGVRQQYLLYGSLD